MYNPTLERTKICKSDKGGFVQRLRDRLNAIGEFGREGVRDPRSVPTNAYGWFRRWFRTLFKVRGGGLYALGYVVTFAWLEVTSLFGDILDSDGVGSFVTGQVIEFAFRFLSESIQNVVKAFLWPIPILQFRPPYGVVILGLMFLVFGRFVKPPLERWLFGDEATDAADVNEEPGTPAASRDDERR